MTEKVVIIGAGQAGLSAATELRKLGHNGPITLIGDEADHPYQRPPLSKKYLTGEITRDRLYLRPAQFFDEQSITLIRSQTVDRLDRAAQQVFVGEQKYEYDHLILTTGATPRYLPNDIGGALEGVHVMRSLADTDRLAPSFLPGKRLLVVGGGYIGLEVAAVAALAGLKVTVIEMADRILQRVAAKETSDYFRALHTSHGVEILENTVLNRLIGDTAVTGAILSNGLERSFDLVIAGIGVSPNDQIAQMAGLAVDNGIAVDSYSQTSDPHIWSAGDCASFPLGQGRVRLESVPNAIDQAENLAGNIMGAKQPYQPKIWFWSDQFDVKLQIAGTNAGYETVVSRPAIKPGSASFWYYRGDVLIAVDAMNDPRSYMVGKRMIESGNSPAKCSVSDPNTDLKSF
jgi:3-phenylpropionate/trans-cinnamate dioxygenase ferredoxin reductase subunit